nr:hypothetical protein [Candidatus Sigynarchaeota archaeon]
HQVVFAYKIAKQQHKLPLFAESVRRFKNAGFTIKYGMLDRGFYRKELLVAFNRWGIAGQLDVRAFKVWKRRQVMFLGKDGNIHCHGL